MIKIQDSFYTDVESIRKLAENACQLTGCGPAVRSDYINNIDYNFYEWFCKNIANEYNLNLNNVVVDTYFSKLTYDGNRRNDGLIHIDGRNPNSSNMTQKDYKMILCGQIYLSEVIDETDGIKFYNLRKEIDWDSEKLFQMTLNGCYDLKCDREKLQEYHDSFHETVSVKNKTNRIISWKAGMIHRSGITEKQKERIVQHFYISLV